MRFFELCLQGTLCLLLWSCSLARVGSAARRLAPQPRAGEQASSLFPEEEGRDGDRGVGSGRPRFLAEAQTAGLQETRAHCLSVPLPLGQQLHGRKV